MTQRAKTPVKRRKKRNKKTERQQLFQALIDVLRAIEVGEVIHAEHKVMRGEHFEKREFTTSTLGKNKNQSVKVMTHAWWGDR